VVVTRYCNLEYTHRVEGEIITERWETPYGILTKRTKHLEFLPEKRYGDLSST